MSERQRWLNSALSLARDAAQVILPIYESDFRVELKDDRSPVTAADREAERFIRERLSAEYPDHAVLGEELGESGPEQARIRWIIDPIDGTLSLTRRVPLFGTLIAVVEDGEPVVGVAHFPALNSTAHAASGDGAFLDDAPIRVSDTQQLGDALVCATGFHGSELDGAQSSEPEVARWTPLLKAAGNFRGWCDCYGHVLVAAGRADAMVDVVMKPWDNAALIPILREAGAAVSTLAGETDDLVNGGSLVSATPAIHSAVLEKLRP
ncbi:MAG: inositol monophosphatase family protein [Myxococcota bacterium]